MAESTPEKAAAAPPTAEHHEGRHELPAAGTRGGIRTDRRTKWVSSALVALLCGLLGLAIATQVRDTGSGDALDSARPSDLLALLDTLHQREASLQQEIASLEQSMATMKANGSDSTAALRDAQARLAALQIEVGTVPATGPGVVLTVDDPRHGVGSDVLLDEIQELRAAGAETMEVAGTGPGHAVRIGVDSWVTGEAGDITVDGQRLSAPYRVTAIGDPPTLAAALNIPGGVVDTVARAGGSARIEQSQQVTVSALRPEKQPQYAQPGG